MKKAPTTLKGVEGGVNGEAGFLPGGEADALAADDGVEVGNDDEQALLLLVVDFAVAFGVLGGLGVVFLLLGLLGGGGVWKRRRFLRVRRRGERDGKQEGGRARRREHSGVMRVMGCKLLGVMGLGEEELLGAEFADRVAEFGGFFELEFFGGFAHVGLELGDVDVELGLGGEVGDAFGIVGEVGVVGFEDAGEAHVDGGNDGGGGDAVFFVVGDLLFAAAVGFVDGALHGFGHLVGVEDGAAFKVAGGAARWSG